MNKMLSPATHVHLELFKFFIGRKGEINETYYHEILLPFIDNGFHAN